MVEYVVQMTEDATKISPAYHARLREVGFDDKGILQITLIAAWFNYINRVADGLGVGRDAAGARCPGRRRDLRGLDPILSRQLQRHGLPKK